MAIAPIKLFNTLTRKLEEFHPLVPGHVGFYSCGPTVYHYTHLGNLRTFIINDLLKRMFMANGYDVRHIMNITDVGHLTDDGDDGDDKMERGAARDNKSVWDVAKFYTDAVLTDMHDLNMIMPTVMPHATDYINEQIELVKKLEALGYTYKIDGDGIYYDTSKFANYGALTGGSVAGNRAGARVEYNDQKRNPTDFALWKFSPENGPKRQMEWDSPWGVGFPGWHLECSAMSVSLLGNHFDLHTGGIDLSRVHHVNEIAQSEPITGAPWVNTWVHYEFLIDKSGEKMSKSTGEFLRLQVLRDRGYDPIVYRYMVCLSHYQSQMVFSWDALDAATAGYKNIVKKIASLLNDFSTQENQEKYNEWHDRVLSAVNNNLQTATAIVIFQEMLSDDTTDNATKIAVVKFIDDLLGLEIVQHSEKLLAIDTAPIPDEIQKLADERAAAKVAKNYALADEIRAKIDFLGYTVMDGKDGMKITKK